MLIIKDEYIEGITSKFHAAANEANALKMKQYMRNQFDFLGIKSPQRREIQHDFFKNYGVPGVKDIWEIAGELWRFPEREFQYVAMELLFKKVKKMDPGHIDGFEELITNKSWWDTVDYLAASHVGLHLKLYPQLIPSVTSAWMNSENMWLQRTCLLFQLKYKEDTDLDLLYGFIENLKDSNEFFIRKAIGWALREYSKTDPEEVKEFVARTKMKPLSQTEALKVINRSNQRKV